MLICSCAFLDYLLWLKQSKRDNISYFLS
uniref:Uncharacterized protein n=1 Tax=Arundo donax TaxID=35708 RepID=A0A0A9FTC5_ARUDO